MLNKIKKLAKKAKEALKHVAEKVDEHIMAKEQIELKKMKLVIDKLVNPKVMFILLSGIGAMAIVTAGTTFIIYKKEIIN